MFLKPLLDSAPLLDAETLPNLLQVGARCVQIAKQMETYQTVVVMATDRKEVELYLQYLRALGVEDAVYYPTPSLSPYEWTGEEKLSSHQRHAIRIASWIPISLPAASS